MLNGLTSLSMDTYMLDNIDHATIFSERQRKSNSLDLNS